MFLDGLPGRLCCLDVGWCLCWVGKQLEDGLRDGWCLLL